MNNLIWHSVLAIKFTWQKAAGRGSSRGCGLIGWTSCCSFLITFISISKRSAYRLVRKQKPLQLSAMDASVRTTMKGAAKCDKHCKLQDSENQQDLERILRFRDMPGSMPTSASPRIHVLGFCSFESLCASLCISAPSLRERATNASSSLVRLEQGTN